MTREEAIKILKDCELNPCVPQDKEAANLAIKALEQQPKILNTLDFAIDASNGDTNYFVGFRNGLRYSKSLIDGKEPQFESCTEQEPCEMTAEEYRQRMIQAFHNADTDELIAICVLPTEKEFEHLEWLLKNHYKKEPCGNAIDRAEAIKVASGYCHPANVTKEHCPHEAKIEPKADTWSIKDVANTFKKHGLIVEQEPCVDAVSRKAVVKYIKASDAELGQDSENELVVEDILNMPSVKPVACIATVKFSKEDMRELVNEKMKEIVVERKKGKWVDIHDRDEWYGDQYRCSLCGNVTIDNGLYCPNCGAEMEGEEDGND